jgi:hypothetical protein
MMNYIPSGSMSQYLISNYNELSLLDKLELLYYIAGGLKDIY